MHAELEEKRVAIEAIANLVKIKQTMYELILKPAGVPVSLFKEVSAQRDPTTGYTLSKRKCAALIIDRLGPKEGEILSRILRITAEWPEDRYHLAANEFEARATVLKARRLRETTEDIERRAVALRAESRIEQDRERHETQIYIQRQNAAERRKQLNLLLMAFDDLTQSEDAQRRGYLLEHLMNQLFSIFDIRTRDSFRRNEQGEQIDGGFQVNG